MDSHDEVGLGIALASRVRVARDLRGYTQGETVGRMRRPITTAALSQIEGGKTRASGTTLRELAAALDVPAGYFSKPWPRGLDGEQLPFAFFRDLRATPVRERRRALALALTLNDLVAAIERRVSLPPVRLAIDPVDAAAGPLAIEGAAETVREDWRLGRDPLPDVVRAIERHGIPVARLAIGHRTVDAFSVAAPPRPLILLTDDKQSYVRSRFDAAHELGHLVLHPQYEAPERTLERQAHRFASSLLLPAAVAEAELPRRIDGAAWGQLMELKRHWGMSLSALLRRARDLRLLNEDSYRNAMKYMSARGWRSAEPGDREMGPPESPQLLFRAIRLIEETDKLSLEEFAEAESLPVDDVIAIVTLSRDDRPSLVL